MKSGFKLENLQTIRCLLLQLKPASSKMSMWVISGVCVCRHTIFNCPASVVEYLRNIKAVTEKNRRACIQAEKRYTKKCCYNLSWPLDISFLTSFGVFQHFFCSSTVATSSLNCFEALLGMLVQNCKGTQESTWSRNTQWKFIKENIMWASNRSGCEGWGRHLGNKI